MNGIAAMILRHWLPVLGLNAVIAAIASYSVLTQEDSWTAKAKLILPNATTELNADLGTLGNITGGEGLVFTPTIDSRQILSSIITSNDSVRRVWEADPEQDLYPRLGVYKDLFEVTTDPTSTIISLNAEGSNPELAQERLSSLIQAFQQRLNELRKDNAVQRVKFFEEELARSEQSLRETQRNLVDFQEATKIVDVDSQTTQLVTALRELTISQGNLVAQSVANQSEVDVLAARLGQSPEQAIRALRLSENQAYQSIREKLAEVDVALVEAQAQFTDEHPQVQYLLTQREELLRQQSGYIGEATASLGGVNTSVGQGQNYADLIQQLILAESQTQALGQQAKQLQTQIDQINGQLGNIPAAHARLLELQRLYDIAEGTYNGLIAQLTANKIDAFSTYPSVQVLDQPISDTKPSGPGAKPIAFGAVLASLFGSAALVLLLEKRNPRLAARDLRETEIPLLGNVPRLKRSTVDNITRQTETAAEFQRLASSISLMPLENRRLMITSSTSGEGKTTVATGLAAALAALGFRVLLVDGDFHRSALSERLGHSRKGAVALESPISVQPNLDLLPLTPSPDKILEFVAQGEFEETLNKAQSTGNYDYLIVDSAPVNLSSETALMAAIVSNVMLVVMPGTSNRHPFRNTLEHLMRVKAHVLGLVINGVAEPSEEYLYSQKYVQVEL